MIYTVSCDYITDHAKKMMYHLSGLISENTKLNTAFEFLSKFFPASMLREQEACPTDGEAAKDEKLEKLVTNLEPLFKSERAARKLAEFVVQDNVKDYKITDFVNQLVGKDSFLESTTKTDLYNALKDADVYQRSRSTWNEQVDMPRPKK
ncbi:MAG: hypothetical protein IKW91_05760 [Bacteroidaceae bacterium]|nr:hypothetical protein [Bacteroidaceae bacterium]